MTLSALISNRNSADTPDTWRGVGARPSAISTATVVPYLRGVRAGAPQSHEGPVASFCGAAGLVTIRGRHAAITPEGLAALA